MTNTKVPISIQLKKIEQEIIVWISINGKRPQTAWGRLSAPFCYRSDLLNKLGIKKTKLKGYLDRLVEVGLLHYLSVEEGARLFADAETDMSIFGDKLDPKKIKEGMMMMKAMFPRARKKTNHVVLLTDSGYNLGMILSTDVYLSSVSKYQQPLTQVPRIPASSP